MAWGCALVLAAVGVTDSHTTCASSNLSDRGTTAALARTPGAQHRDAADRSDSGSSVMSWSGVELVTQYQAT